MVSELRRRKITVLFNVDDQDNDGFLEKEDFKRIADLYSDMRGWRPGSSGYDALYSLFMDWWSQMREAADRDRDDRVSLDEAIDGLERMSQGGAEKILEASRIVFDTLDADGDGNISVREYRQLLASISVDAAVADVMFGRLDTDGDGIISRQEFGQLFVDFYVSDDPSSPGNWLWGPF